MKREYTREEKAAYFKGLREQWARTKALAEQEPIKAAFYEAQKCSEKGFSPRGFAYVYAQMQAAHVYGLPYIDAKTFEGWQKAGFRVIKGEKSFLSGITWIKVGNHAVAGVDGVEGDEGEGGFLMPKVYVLFHRSQVAAHDGTRPEPVRRIVITRPDAGLQATVESRGDPVIIVKNVKGEEVKRIPIAPIAPVSEVKAAADALSAIPMTTKTVVIDALRQAVFA